MESDFLNVLQERGFIHQCTNLNNLDEYLLANSSCFAYAGFDLTASSLHVGHLLPLMVLRWFSKCGGQPIILYGGATTKIGDPSGKDNMRKMLSVQEIQTNLSSIKHVISKFFQNVLITEENNSEWLDKLSWPDALFQYARHFTVNRMLAMDSVKLRKEITLMEFNYMVMQAVDFVKLNEKYNCRIQIGGSDQWGNITNGIDLQRRIFAEENVPHQELFGLTLPLLSTSDGKKMGKTETGAVWLDKDLLSHYDYWQFWRNTVDADVGKFLRLFTELSINEILKLETLQGAEINEAKKILATEATKICHGEFLANQAQEISKKTFEENTIDTNLKTVFLDDEQLDIGISICELLVMADLCESNSDARRLISNNGISINNKKVENSKLIFTSGTFTPFKLSKGKKQHVLVRYDGKST